MAVSIHGNLMDQIIAVLFLGMEHMVLVQWHPEELQDSEPRMRGLFKNLIEKASK